MRKEKVIKETKYCQILAQSKVSDGAYTYCIEKVYIKEMNRPEIRFCLYKDVNNQLEKYVPRSLDVTELELLDLMKGAISLGIFSKELIEGIRGAITHKKSKDTMSLHDKNKEEGKENDK